MLPRLTHKKWRDRVVKTATESTDKAVCLAAAQLIANWAHFYRYEALPGGLLLYYVDGRDSCACTCSMMRSHVTALWNFAPNFRKLHVWQCGIPLQFAMDHLWRTWVAHGVPGEMHAVPVSICLCASVVGSADML